MKKIWGLIGLCLLSVSAQAALLDFQLTRTDGEIYSWQLDENPTPFFSRPGVTAFRGVPVATNGAPPELRYLYFNVSPNSVGPDGGLAIDDVTQMVRFYASTGPQLFTGSNASPQFSPGTFQLTGDEGYPNATLAISAVPVPGAVWLFGSALGVMGVMRRKLAS